MIDIKQTADGDVDLNIGDITLVEPTAQHKRDILISSPGDFAESPLIGVGLYDYINASDDGLMRRSIARQMQQDGINIARIGFDVDGLLIIDGSYEDDKN